MSMKHEADDLGLMNAAVALVVLIPLLLVLWSTTHPSPNHDAVPGPRLDDVQPPPPLDQPPIITISEAQVFSFSSGSAVPTAELRQFLLEVAVPTIEAIASRYDCDTVEVIGHTDSQRVLTRSDLDRKLLASLRDTAAMATPGSNADLGLLRAWKVIEILKSDNRLSDKWFVGYSAADLILEDGRSAEFQVSRQDEPRRRRIEIRARRSAGHRMGLATGADRRVDPRSVNRSRTP